MSVMIPLCQYVEVGSAQDKRKNRMSLYDHCCARTAIVVDDYTRNADIYQGEFVIPAHAVKVAFSSLATQRSVVVSLKVLGSP
ncbi:MAG: hypothetical protein GTN71_17225 [Anaerolineae bacterium]|nr:hypothetical protein [Anaerolineae bacterium]